MNSKYMFIWVLGAFFSLTRPALAQDIETQSVEVLNKIVAAVEKKDFETFQGLFAAKRVIGPQPEELWQGSFTVLSKFGKVQSIEFARKDERTGGAFVKVTFERATREIYLRFNEEGKLRQLEYVPPTNVNQKPPK